MWGLWMQDKTADTVHVDTRNVQELFAALQNSTTLLPEQQQSAMNMSVAFLTQQR